MVFLQRRPEHEALTPTSDKQTVCLLGSPRRGGNSDVLAARFCDRAAANGATVDTVALSDLTFHGCRNLFHCKNDLTHCGQLDDLTSVLEQVANAQILVLASPVYFTNVSGVMKQAIDRFFSFFVPDYTTARQKSRLGTGRTLVFVQTQGEPEGRYADLMDSYQASFDGLGFTERHLIRAWGVREPGEVAQHAQFLERCDSVAEKIYHTE